MKFLPEKNPPKGALNIERNMSGNRGEYSLVVTVAEVLGTEHESRHRALVSAGVLCYGTQSSGGKCMGFNFQAHAQAVNKLAPTFRDAQYSLDGLNTYDAGRAKLRDGESVCQACSQRLNGFTCFGTTLFECPIFTLEKERKKYKKYGQHGICSACNTAWTALSQARKAAGRYNNDDTRPDENVELPVWGGTHGLSQSRMKLRDDCTPAKCTSARPVAFACDVVQKMIIHEFYSSRARACEACGDVDSQTLVEVPLCRGVPQRHDLCTSCLDRLREIVQDGANFTPTRVAEAVTALQKKSHDAHRTRDDVRRTFFSVFDLPNDGEPARVVFTFARTSQRGGSVSTEVFDVNNVLRLVGRTYAASCTPVFPGAGPIFISLERYTKSGSATLSLISSHSARLARDAVVRDATYADLVDDVNEVTRERTQCVAHIFVGSTIDFCAYASDLWLALIPFQFPKRVFIVSQCVASDVSACTVSVDALLQRLSHPCDLKGDDVASIALAQAHIKATEPLRGGGSKQRTFHGAGAHIDMFSPCSGSLERSESDPDLSLEITRDNDADTASETPTEPKKNQLEIVALRTLAQRHARSDVIGLHAYGDVAVRLERADVNDPHTWYAFRRESSPQPLNESYPSTVEGASPEDEDDYRVETQASQKRRTSIGWNGSPTCDTTHEKHTRRWEL